MVEKKGIEKKVVLGIIQKNDKFLMVRQSKRRNLPQLFLRKSSPWVFPGGKVDDGETLKEAVEREIFEETSLICTPTSMIGYRDHPKNQRSLRYLACEYNRGRVKINKELKDSKWMRPLEIIEITKDLYPPVEKYLVKKHIEQIISLN